jgi:hypothetical protein
MRKLNHNGATDTYNVHGRGRIGNYFRHRTSSLPDGRVGRNLALYGLQLEIAVPAFERRIEEEESAMTKYQSLRARLLTASALALALALPVAGQFHERSWNREHSRSVETGATKVIAIQVWADPLGSGRAERYGVSPDNQAVPVRPGDRLRLTLVGTGLFNGEGEEVPVGATFNVEAGRDISILHTGSNWVEVAVGGDSRGIAGQIGYRVRGGYEMRGALTNGRITLEAQRSVRGADYGRGEDYGRGGDRYDGNDSGYATRREKARLVARALVEGIVNTPFDPARDRDRVIEIYEQGYRGVRQNAQELAYSVERRRIALDPQTTVFRLYRVLLKRSPDQIESDRGYHSNVQALRRSGLQAVVRTIVESPEFRRAYDLDHDFDGYRQSRR